MSRVRRSLIIVFFSSNGATAVNFIVSIILARLLSPDDIGIFSITVVVTNIAHIFRDFGVTSYLKTVKDLTPGTIRAANGVLIASSWSMGLFLFLLSGWVADYYRQPGIYDVMRVLSLGFLFIPFGAITLALLGRELRAEATTWINVGGVSAYAISSISLAYLDFGYMSMAWANLINIVATALASAPFRPQYAPWMPSFKGWNKIINFGTGAIMGSIAWALNNALPDVVIGKLSGPYDVGIMSRANSTTNIFSQIAGPAVSYTALPHLAQVHNDGKSLNPIIKKATNMITGIGWPALVGTIVFAPEIIKLLYGEKWVDCIPIVQILCLSSMVQFLTHFNGTAYTAIGRPYIASLPEFSLLFLRILCITILYDGALESFGWALVTASILNYPIHFYLQIRFLKINSIDVTKSIKKSVLTTVLFSAIAVTVKNGLSSFTSSGIAILIALIILLPSWLIILRLSKHILYDEFSQIVFKRNGRSS